jgi:hypothetical protein
MVGFKSIALLFILLIFAACVPQTKQTECGSSEAFNATLRTCVPVMNGPSSFIDINSFLPTSVLSKYKNDSTIINFTVTISNPYAQTFSVVWERSYNGSPVSLVGSVSGTTYKYSMAPSLLSTQIGTHIITAKVLDSSNSIVDSHSFELKINDNPKPVIVSSSINPPYYDSSFTPTDADQNFKFTVSNNGATLTGANYRTDWKLYKSGVLQTAESETDTFPTVGGSTSSGGYNYPSYTFSPATLGVGAYLLNARVTNSAQEVVAEQQWSVSVAHPSLSKIIRRDIYELTTNPSFGVASVAYHGIAYTSAPTYNFIPTGFSAQGDYCVQVASAEGTYAGDGYFVRVDFYIDGASLVYSGTTSISPINDNKICLSDAPAGVLNSVIFNNTSTTSTQSHTLVARVVDEATGQEYSAANMNGSLGAYPISWGFTVKPANAAPTVTFTAASNLSNITCGAGTTTSKTCTVTQDQSFTLGIKAIDDFDAFATHQTSSTTDSVQAKFTYTMTLLRNGSPVPGQVCTKTTANVNDTGSPDAVGPDYLCDFTVASSDINGSIHPTGNAYSVSILFCDEDSPITGTTAMCANLMTYNLNVTEANTAPTIAPQLSTSGVLAVNSYISESGSPTTILNPGTAAQYITEGQTLNINVRVADTEMDDYQVKVYLCTDFTINCATFSQIASQTVNKTDNVASTLTTLTYALTENFLPVGTAVNTNVKAFFKVVVTDIPDTLTPGLESTTDSTISPMHFQVNVRNRNPAPQITGTASPLVTDTTLTAMVGYPLTIDPGTVTDASNVSTENTISYQWYVDANNGDNSFTAITGATERILRWTPSNGLTAGGTVNLALCVSDGTVVNPQPTAASPATTVQATMASLNPATGPNCIGSWDVVVQPNAVALNYDNNAGVDVGADVAIWQDNTASTEKKVIYSAYADVNGTIFVEKTVFDANGTIFNDSTSGFQTVSFEALRGGTQSASTVKDISLAGTKTHLYIAYQAADASTPSSPRIRVRRIDKRYGVISLIDYGSKLDSSYPHLGKFGFSYDDNPTILTTLFPTTTSSNIDIFQTSFGAPIVVDFVGDLTQSEVLVTNGVTMTADDAPNSDELCSGSLGACTPSGNATRYESFINNSADRLLQGVTAADSGSSVGLYGGLSGGEYLDTHPSILTYIPGKLGKIMIIGGNWYLPFVDNSTAGTIGYIRYLTAGAADTDVLNSTLTVNTNYYSTIGSVNWFANEVDPSGNIVIASVSTSNIAQLTKYTTAPAIVTAPVNLFSGSPISASTLRFSAAMTSNPNYYVAAKVLTALPSTYEWMIGRYDASFALDYVNRASILTANHAATGTVMSVSNVKDVSIQTYAITSGTTTEARLMVASTNGGASTNLYALRFRSDNELSCGSCVQINLSTEVLSASKRIASTPIDLGMTIGTAGSSATSTENTRNILFAIYPVSTSSGIYKPQMGIFNMQVESINSTSTSTTGLLGHRPPFIGSN